MEVIIRTGVSEDEAQEEDVKQSYKRVGSPTKKHHDLGVITAFTTKAKALEFMNNYFKLNQDSQPDDLQMTEISITS